MTTITVLKDDTANLSLEGEKIKISKKEKKAWLTAESINSINAYKDYIKAYPDGVMKSFAQQSIDYGYNRHDELMAIDVNAPDDINLNRLPNTSISESSDYVDIDLLSINNGNGEPLRDALVRLQPNCKDEKSSSLYSDQNGMTSVRIKKGCCYNLSIRKEGFQNINKLLCTDELNDSSLKFFIEENSSSVFGNDDSDSLEAPITIIYDSVKKLYYTSEGKLFTGEYDGKTIVNGKVQLGANGKTVTEKEEKVDENENTETIVNDDTSTSSNNEVLIPPTAIEIDKPNYTIKTLTEECAINIKSKGVLAYNSLPTEMKIDSSYRLEILINELDNIDKIKDEVEKQTGDTLNTSELIHEGTATIGDQTVEIIRIGSWMRVTLSEPKNQNAFDLTNAFESEAENIKGQNIDCDMNAKWKWLITPTKGGNHTLLLNFALKTDENSTSWKVLDDVEKQIQVTVEEEAWLSQLMLPGGIGIALLSLFLFWWRSRKKKQDDLVFGANLGIAGGVKNVATPPTKPKSVFIAYAKEDEEWTKQIYNQMKVLHKGGYVNIWYDQLLEAGSEYKAEIFKHIDESDIIILNISSDFLACDFCDELMSKAMERQQRGEGVVLIPIIVRPCLWATTPLSNVNVFPKNKKPLSDEEWKNVDNAIVNVMTEVEAKLLN